MQFISSIITSSHAHDLIIESGWEFYTLVHPLCCISESAYQVPPVLSTVEELQVLGCIGNYMEQTSRIFTAFHPGGFFNTFLLLREGYPNKLFTIITPDNPLCDYTHSSFSIFRRNWGSHTQSYEN